MEEADIWTTHLQPDEHLLWQARVVEARYLAELSRQRKLGLGIGLAALAAMALFGARLPDFIHAKPASHAHPTDQAAIIDIDLSGVFFLPIYVAAVLACLIIAVAQITRLNPRRPAAVRYAVTNGRLLALDAKCALIEETPGADIVSVYWSALTLHEV